LKTFICSSALFIFSLLYFQAIFAEIPGVLETGSVRKIDRKYPFNDACQWFIDHAGKSREDIFKGLRLK
jgi:hypothetical protein